MGNNVAKNSSSSMKVESQRLFKEAAEFMQREEFSKAAEHYRAMLYLQPHHSGGWLNLGTALRRLGHMEASVACAKRALDLSPGQASILTNLGNCLVDLDRKEEAIAAHREAVQIQPQDFLIRRNYAIALRDFGLYEQALEQFDIALSLQPKDIATEWDRAITYLYLGRYAEGWQAFECRWNMGKLKPRPCTAPRWQGEDIQGKTLLVHEEQGFGDSILCSRYIPLIHSRGGKVVLECKKQLHRLFESLPGVIDLTEMGQYKGQVDFHIPMMSLPGIFKTDLHSIPAPHLFSVSEKLPVLAQHLLNLAKDRLKVGIVWSGSTTFQGNHKRAVSLDRFLTLAEVPNIQLYSLQKGPLEKDIAESGASGLIYDLAPCLNDFADTAAIIEKLDLIIMTDSSVAHLAGSLGRPVWNLLGSRPYWLYLHEREDSPWYPSMRLFRQPRHGDWDSVFKAVKQELFVLTRPL